ncbi:cupin domain-containing protein [Piscinibacter sp. HJYY11]|uniref:cupin domain-containing protein n=1 Tax=Piscinibacter sp. HJYY11 TaxID=2801333 RepID=UPI001F197449|nr:cupin domain-containing protein [Piscinibacter sp. HJYY11]
MRAKALIEQLRLQPHPEGGHYREFFRSPHSVTPGHGRPRRSALTSIDFLLQAGEFSAWHRVASDEAWHLLEGDPLTLWCVPPSLDRIEQVTLAPASTTATPRHVVPAGWWQAAAPLGEFAYVGATVAPGFEFVDFGFGRDDTAFIAALKELDPTLLRLAGGLQR